MTKEPWQCEDEMEKMISINQYSEDYDVLKRTLQKESLINVKSIALIFILKLKPMGPGDLKRFLSDEVGMSVDEAIELIEYTTEVLEKL